jgi:hypothetical protein
MLEECYVHQKNEHKKCFTFKKMHVERVFRVSKCLNFHA